LSGIYEAGKPLDFKTCMDLTRAIFEKITQDAAAKAAEPTKRPLPPATASHFQPWNQVLMSLGVLSEKEGDVTQKLHNYLSVAGAHALGSAPEQVRVAKNTVVEWGLLIVGRVHAMTATASSG
jgi:hypothetical protein